MHVSNLVESTTVWKWIKFRYLLHTNSERGISMARKLIVCISIFLTLWTVFFILDYGEREGIAKQGITTTEESGVLQIQVTELERAGTRIASPFFGPREYVKIVPR